MEIYFVRHGETMGNIARRHQSQNTSLTERGKEQIRVATETLKTVHPTHLVTSTVLRAVESAQLLAEAFDIIPETHEVFRELDRPEFLHGHYHKSIGSLWFYALWYLGIANNKKVGGESYRDLRERIVAAQTALSQYPEDARLVVVSHSVFINFFVAHLCQKRPLNPLQAAYRFMKVLTIKNGSITKVVYSPNGNRKCGWRLQK